MRGLIALVLLERGGWKMTAIWSFLGVSIGIGWRYYRVMRLIHTSITQMFNEMKVIRRNVCSVPFLPRANSLNMCFQRC